MNRTILSLFLLATGISGLRAQDTPQPIEFPENEEQPVIVEHMDDENLFIPESWDTDLDSLLNAWHVQYYVDKNAHPGYSDAVTASDSVYAERLSKLNNIIALPYNNIVRRCIELYVDRRRTIVEYMLGLENFYFPLFEQALDANRLPLELKYLPIIESALNPTAFSRAGASGLWQFMIGTGKQYGLEVNSLIDERRDPVKSTQAACTYLKDLFGIYGDWSLVLAAYNCGPGNVNKAIRRAGGSTDYWKIYPYLPQETRLYVPLFIAANYVMNYYAHHQLYPVQTVLPIATDTVMVNQAVHFDQIAEVLNVDRELLRALNPQYKRDIIPGNSQPRAIRLPALQAYAFVEKENSIVNHRKDELLSGRAASNTPEKIIHKVQSGETIHAISGKYGVSTANIKKWNGLKSNRLAKGKRLTIYVDNGGYALASAPVQTLAPKTESSSTASSGSPASGQSSAEYGRYKVKPGDSFYSISKRYPGCSPTDLMKINNIKSSKLKAGQYIKVPKV
ncbi:MAG: transglycosylase SLT domain-containing protein [Dysgonamonadaceae bacterium]|jgi:membrane-bound lytic murein transglycosylase D|nr:transglycosylase SLT domain-containing protein [Dysgonamonadaceae bacterium]